MKKYVTYPLSIHLFSLELSLFIRIFCCSSNITQNHLRKNRNLLVQIIVCLRSGATYGHIGSRSQMMPLEISFLSMSFFSSEVLYPTSSLHVIGKDGSFSSRLT